MIFGEGTISQMKPKSTKPQSDYINVKTPVYQKIQDILKKVQKQVKTGRMEYQHIKWT